MNVSTKKLPNCEKHNLLRTLGSCRVVVSSRALHDLIGGKLYQDFIEFNGIGNPGRPGHRFRQPPVGFDPVAVEIFLTDKALELA